MTTMQVTPQPHHDNWGHRLLKWTPRILSLAFVAFLALFALDVFGVGYSAWETLVALFMHLIPNFILLAIVIVAWRWPWVGALGFLGIAAFFAFQLMLGDWVGLVLLIGLPALTGLLYLADWLARRRSHA